MSTNSSLQYCKNAHSNHNNNTHNPVAKSSSKSQFEFEKSKSSMPSFVLSVKKKTSYLKNNETVYIGGLKILSNRNIKI